MQKAVGYVYTPDGMPLARQTVNGSNSYITWKHATPAGTGQHDYNVGGWYGSGVPDRVELDPLGASVPLEYIPPPQVQNEGDIGPGPAGGIFDSRWSNFFDVSGGCTAQGVTASCRDAASALNNLGVMRLNLIQVTINITYRNGTKKTLQFVTTSNVIRSGFNRTFRGSAAVAAATEWNRGLSGGLNNALIGSIFAGFAAEARAARHHAAQESAMAIAQRKNCATPNSIVEQYKLEFEAQWNRTLRTGEENGALIFYEQAANSYFRLSLSEGRHFTDRITSVPAMPEVRRETRNAFDDFSRQGRSLYLLAFFHTHPNFPHTGESRSGDPSGDDVQYQSDHGNALGILRTGKGYSFFSNGRTFRPDDPRANECIWIVNNQRR